MKTHHHTLSGSQNTAKRNVKVFRPFKETKDQSIFANLPLKAIVLLLLILFLLGLRGLATTYYTAANGIPSNTANWWSNPNGTGSHPVNFATAADVFEIQSGNNMTTTADWTVAGTVVIDAGGTLTVATGDKLTIATVTVNGLFLNQSNKAHAITTMSVNSGATFEHAVDGGTIPTATWASTSTCLITGYDNSEPAGDGQAFGNLTYNCTIMSGPGGRSLAASGLSVTGDLTLSNSNGHELQMVQASVTVSGNCTINTNFRLANNGNARTLTVNGKFTLSGGTFKMTDNNDVGILNIGGDMEITGGTLTETSGTAPDSAVVVFTSGTHTYTKTGGTISQHVDFRVETNAVLDVGTSIINGSIGTFNLKDGAGLITANTNGITASTASGSIQVTGLRYYSTGADYTYNAAANQADGDGMPTVVRNLTITNIGASGNNTFTLGHSTNVTQNVTINSGILSEASGVGIHTAGNVIIASSGTFLGGNGTHYVGGNWTNNGTFTANTSTLIFDGASAQIIEGSSTTTYNNVTFSGGGKKNLSITQTVDGQASFSNGIVVSTASAPLVFSSTGTVTGAGENSFVSGPVTKSGTAAFVYPVGKDTTSFTHYQPLEIGVAAVSNTFTVEYFRSGNAFMDRPKQFPVVAVSMCEYWNVDRSAGSSAVDVTLHGNANSGCGTNTGASYFDGLSLNDLRVVHWNGTEWDDANTGTNAVAGTSPNITVTAQGVNSFSPFSFGSVGSNPLPVKLVQFTGKISDNNVVLRWSTASERNNDHFDVERSFNGTQFIKVGEVAGAGNSISTRYYSFNDPVAEMPQGAVYYRLKHVDYNQTAEYSSVIVLHIVKAGGVAITTVSPNPFGDRITVQYSTGVNGAVTVRLLNMHGVEVSQTHVEAVRGDNTVSFSTDAIAQGMYLLRIENANQAVTNKVLIKN